MTMRHRSSRRYSSDLLPIVRLWILRLLVPLGAKSEFICSHGWRNETLARLLGVENCLDNEPVDDLDENTRKSAANLLGKLHKQVEKNLGNVKPPVILTKNISKLSVMVGLSATECRILEFATLLHSDALLDDTADWLGHMSMEKTYQTISLLLDLPESEVKSSLSTKGLLHQSGLLSLDSGLRNTLKEKLNILSDSFASIITSSDTDPMDMLREIVAKAAPPQLELADYDHISKSLNILRPYLRQALNENRKGVNIYIYGPPGTGKTQLARVLAQECQCNLFEVSCEDEDGDQTNRDKRLRACRSAQSFLSKSHSILVFDEAEDVFNDGNELFFLKKKSSQKNKGWFNNMLENNSIPTFWLSNTMEGLDPAFIRRFDMIFELPVPPRKQRQSILKEVCGDMIDDRTVAFLSESEVLAPAVVARAASVINTIRDELGPTASVIAFERLIGNTLEAQGHKPIRHGDPNRLPELYDPSFIHSDSDLSQIVNGLARTKAGRICLYGPPGTGKTAYGRWLAEQLEMPLLVRHASDLLSKWVGEAEKNIAYAFRLAEQDGALLLIDEVDSFLQDRRNAAQTWEVTQVNEMLTQMEGFTGVFIATTNLMDGLDQATLRRFDLKVKLDYLRPAQVWILFQRHCHLLEFSPPTPELKFRLERQTKLTPGDFSAVVRQHRFRPIGSATELADALEAECQIKEGPRTAIGFI